MSMRESDGDAGRGRILDGKATALALRAVIADRVGVLVADGVQPGLAVVLVGEDPASEIYVRNKDKAASAAGIAVQTLKLGEGTTQAELEETQAKAAEAEAVSASALESVAEADRRARALEEEVQRSAETLARRGAELEEAVAELGLATVRRRRPSARVSVAARSLARTRAPPAAQAESRRLQSCLENARSLMQEQRAAADAAAAELASQLQGVRAELEREAELRRAGEGELASAAARLQAEAAARQQAEEQATEARVSGSGGHLLRHSLRASHPPAAAEPATVPAGPRVGGHGR